MDPSNMIYIIVVVVAGINSKFTIMEKYYVIYEEWEDYNSYGEGCWNLAYKEFDDIDKANHFLDYSPEIITCRESGREVLGPLKLMKR